MIKRAIITYIFAVFAQFCQANAALATSPAEFICTGFPRQYSADIDTLEDAFKRVSKLKSVNFCDTSDDTDRFTSDSEGDVEFLGISSYNKIFPKLPEFASHLAAFDHYSKHIADKKWLPKMVSFWNDLSSSKSVRDKEFEKYSIIRPIDEPIGNLKNIIAKAKVVELDLYLDISIENNTENKISPYIIVKSETEAWKIYLKDSEGGYEIELVFYYETWRRIDLKIR